MNKTVELIPISDVRERTPTISFPEYQRESTVWDRRKQQRLIDSIMRGFDISAFYFYRTDDGELECIDGRQRLTAILSFTGDLEDPDNGPYAMLFENEIAPERRSDLDDLRGLTFSDLEESDLQAHRQALARFNSFEITAVILSESHDEFEFNLQFTRLNLGTIINSGEKLHAMEGDMHDLCFKRIGKHQFLEGISIPTRRYASEQVAAQFLSQIYSLEETGGFRRMRHYDLQRFFKQKFKMSERDEEIGEEVDQLLTDLHDQFDDDLALLRNRALTVSLVLLAWVERTDLDHLKDFWRHFMDRLNRQLQRVKDLQAVDEQYHWMMDFQKDVTQASVERPAVERRHEVLRREFNRFRNTGEILGDGV